MSLTGAAGWPKPKAGDSRRRPVAQGPCMKNLGIGPNLAFALLGIVILVTFAIAVLMANRGTVKKRRSRGERHRIDLYRGERRDEDGEEEK